MPLPLIALAAGSVARMAGGRMAASAITSGGSPAAGRAMQFGGQALQMSGQRPQRQDRGVTQWAKENPGEATVAGVTGAVRMLTSSGLADSANRDFSSVIQTSQFRPQ